MKTTLLRSVACLAMFGSALAHAQTYPTKTITMVVPFAAGGPIDVVARLVEVISGLGSIVGAFVAAGRGPDR